MLCIAVRLFWTTQLSVNFGNSAGGCGPNDTQRGRTLRLIGTNRNGLEHSWTLKQTQNKRVVPRRFRCLPSLLKFWSFLIHIGRKDAEGLAISFLSRVIRLFLCRGRCELRTSSELVRLDPRCEGDTCDAFSWEATRETNWKQPGHSFKLFCSDM